MIAVTGDMTTGRWQYIRLEVPEALAYLPTRCLYS